MESGQRPVGSSIYKSYKFRIFPTQEQEVLISKHFGCVRWVYNWALSKRIERFRLGEKIEGIYKISKDLTILKNSGDFDWLKEVSDQSLRSALFDLDDAYYNFFDSKTRPPVFKKKSGKQTFRCIGDISVESIGRIRIPVVKWVKANIHREVLGKIVGLAISKSSTNKYYASITVKTDLVIPPKSITDVETSVGIDLGLKNFAVLSNGEKFPNHKFLIKSLKKLAFNQRRLSRMVKGSKNSAKQKIKIAKIYEKASNLKNNYIHNLTTKLVKDNQFNTFCLEDLSIENMIKNKKLSKHISDVGWGEFIRQLSYKSDWCGKNIERIGRFEPSSKMCSCGEINQTLKLSQRHWTCSKCGVSHDRDVLAANNIKKIALINKIGEESLRINVCGDVSIETPVKQKVKIV